MAGTTVLGQRSTGLVLQDNRKIDISETIKLLEPDATPLTTLSNALGTKATVNPEFFWLEDELKARFDAVDTTTGTGTSVRVDRIEKFSVGDTVLVPRTMELMHVDAVTTGTSTLTVERGVGGSAVALADNDELMIIGRAFPEGDTAPSARSMNPVKVTNYTQIYKNTVESTGTLIHSDSFTRPNDWPYQARKVLEEHKKDQEYTRLFGKPREDLTGGSNRQPLRFTGGCTHFIQTNITDIASLNGGLLTESEFWEWLSTLTRYGSKKVLVLAARLVVNALQEFPRSKLQVMDRAQTYGVTMTQMVSPHGEARIVTHDLLEGSVFGGTAIGLDMSQIRRRVLANSEGSRDTHLRPNVQSPGLDGRQDEYLTEDGLEFGQEKCHGILEGVTGADVRQPIEVAVTVEDPTP